MSDLTHAVKRAVQTFVNHPECINCTVLSETDNSAIVQLILNVEMPFAWRDVGESPNGVRCSEVITVKFDDDYPWSTPHFSLRTDFNRSLPHLQPGSKNEPPVPCLVYGSLNEYFLEAGLLALVEQLRIWLCRAAKGELINASQGWEPIVRNELVGEFIGDQSYLRSLVRQQEGASVLKTSFLRFGDKDGKLGADTFLYGRVYSEKTTLKHSDKSPLIQVKTEGDKAVSGSSITFVVWPGKESDGSPIIANQYFPETIESLGELLDRAKNLKCFTPLKDCLIHLYEVFKNFTLEVPIPIVIFLCVRRPYNLIGVDSDIELLPYAFDLRLSAGSNTLQEQLDTPVIPIRQLDAISQTLLQATSGSDFVLPVALLGCGSVGSKVALHLARNGTQVSDVVDNAFLRPHNLARHALTKISYEGKATSLSKVLQSLGQTTRPHEVNINAMLSDPKKRKKAISKNVEYVIDTTASLQVRSRISSIKREKNDPRFASMALFGGGRGAYIMLEGAGGIPSIDDLTNAYYREIATDPDLREATTTINGELEHVATGQGCGSMTMKMTDSRVSSLAAGLVERFIETTVDPRDSGHLIVGLTGKNGSNIQWQESHLEAPILVTIVGGDGWLFRFDPEILREIRADVALYPNVETGGILLGRVNERIRSISVVGLIPAPSDSKRSASGFVLGTKDARSQIETYHRLSGHTLYDVGTWHSHINDSPPSQRDYATAKLLAGERPPPFALLIVSPNNLFGIMHNP